MDSLRPILAILVALAALTATSAGSSATPAVTVLVTPSAPSPVAGGREPNGRRTYSVAFRVNIAADQECPNLSVSYSYETLFDGRPSLSGSAEDYYDTNAPASSASFDVHTMADPADLVAFSARGTCEDADGNTISESKPVAARLTVPAHTCEQGPVRVFAAKRTVRQDLRTPGQHVLVRAGHHLWADYRVWVAKHGHVTYGAPECHGLRATVAGAATFIPGDYARRGYGASMQLGFGGAADFRGDQHSGGVETANAVALPRGKVTAPAKIARFEIVSYPKKLGRVTRVHVKQGTVYVAGRMLQRGVVYGRTDVVRAGQTVYVRCTGRICKLG